MVGGNSDCNKISLNYLNIYKHLKNGWRGDLTSWFGELVWLESWSDWRVGLAGELVWQESWCGWRVDVSGQLVCLANWSGWRVDLGGKLISLVS